MNRKKFVALQNEWYAKLKRKGFVDLEWYDPKTGKGQNSDHLNSKDRNVPSRYNEFTESHYRICQNFLTHSHCFTRKERKIFQFYTDGLTFRAIIKECMKLGRGYYYDWRGKKAISLYSLHKLIKRYIRYAYAWNKIHPEGLLAEDTSYQYEAEADYLDWESE